MCRPHERGTAPGAFITVYMSSVSALLTRENFCFDKASTRSKALAWDFGALMTGKFSQNSFWFYTFEMFLFYHPRLLIARAKGHVHTGTWLPALHLCVRALGRWAHWEWFLQRTARQPNMKWPHTTDAHPNKSKLNGKPELNSPLARSPKCPRWSSISWQKAVCRWWEVCSEQSAVKNCLD